MYDDMMIQELNEDELEQIVGGQGGLGDGIAVLTENLIANLNANTASSISVSVATGGTATATTGPITITLITI